MNSCFIFFLHPFGFFGAGAMSSGAADAGLSGVIARLRATDSVRAHAAAATMEKIASGKFWDDMRLRYSHCSGLGKLIECEIGPAEKKITDVVLYLNGMLAGWGAKSRLDELFNDVTFDVASIHLLYIEFTLVRLELETMEKEWKLLVEYIEDRPAPLEGVSAEEASALGRVGESTPTIMIGRALVEEVSKTRLRCDTFGELYSGIKETYNLVIDAKKPGGWAEHLSEGDPPQLVIPFSLTQMRAALRAAPKE